MRDKTPLQRLKEIKPRLYLYRDEAIAHLFKDIYEIIKIELKKLNKTEFLIVPVSGKHIHEHTKEHFFISGAPIGLFNFRNNIKKAKALASILTYTLFNRKNDISATSILNTIKVKKQEGSIVSFASIECSREDDYSIFKNDDYIKRKYKKPTSIEYEKIWKKTYIEILEKITKEVDLNEKQQAIPEMEDLLNNLPDWQIPSNDFEERLGYVINNLLVHSKTSGLSNNFYFPSLYFLLEKDNNISEHSYGFMVVSTNNNLRSDFRNKKLMEFFERISVVTFSLVGIIEQHHYSKMETYKAKIQLIDKLPEYLLRITDEINNSSDIRLFQEINNSFYYNPLKKAASIILRHREKEITSYEDIVDYKNRQGKGLDLFLWNNNPNKKIIELKEELKKQRFCYRYNELHNVLAKNLEGYEHAIRHARLNYLSSTNKTKFWSDYEALFCPFKDLIDEQTHYNFNNYIFAHIINTINDKFMSEIEKDLTTQDLDYYLRMLANDGDRRPNSSFDTMLNWKMSNKDYEDMKATIKANIRNKEISFNALETFDDEKWHVLYHQTDIVPLNKEAIHIINNKLQSKEYLPEKINTLKAMVCDYYMGELMWLSKKGANTTIIPAQVIDDNKLLHSPEQILSEKYNNVEGTFYFIYLPKQI